MFHGNPLAAPGARIGLLGGSFDPPHAGHVHITHEALRRFGLDQVWWLVSPGNPLKAVGPAPLAHRMAACRALIHDPRVRVTDIEAGMGSHHTACTLAALRRLYPRVRFVWLMGADNLAGFHRWQHWQAIMQSVPVGVLARPGKTLAGLTSPMSRRYAGRRLPTHAARLLALAHPPVWCFVNVPMSARSSTAIRASGGWVH